MHVLVAPDSFKGTHPAEEVAGAVGRGLVDAGHTVDLAPVADGGEGTARVLARALDATWTACGVTDPLGHAVDGGFYLTTDAVALVDTATASGLALVPHPTPATALDATTYGTGELVAAAVAAGARRILLGVGGSATTDGGRGALHAIAAAGGLRGARLRVLCDVTTTYLDAARVFGPQKGADAETVARLTRDLDACATRLPRDPRGVPHSGAAGGLAGALWAAWGATLVPGAAEVLGVLDVAGRAARADAVMTGEGRFDAQSLLGKLVVAVRDATDRPVHLVVGSSELDAAAARAAGFASLTVAGDPDALRAAGRSITGTP